MSNVIPGKIDEEINKLVRQWKGQLTPALQKNLRKLRLMIVRVLGGEDNVKIKIYISDELDEPECFQMGKGENEIVFDIEEDGIDHEWTKKTLWRKIKDFFSFDKISLILKWVMQAIRCWLPI